MTTAIVSPLLTLGYAFIVDWRCCQPCRCCDHVITVMSQTKGMGEKTAMMDQKLAKISETMLEFSRGITLVKAFGKVGQANDNYQRAADDFSRLLS